jgi:hypothetical protein
MRLAQQKAQWPTIPLPHDRGRITAADVIAVPPGEHRDRAIDDWCRSVWAAYRDSAGAIRALLQARLHVR